MYMLSLWSMVRGLRSLVGGLSSPSTWGEGGVSTVSRLRAVGAMPVVHGRFEKGR